MCAFFFLTLNTAIKPTPTDLCAEFRCKKIMIIDTHLSTGGVKWFILHNSFRMIYHARFMLRLHLLLLRVYIGICNMHTILNDNIIISVIYINLYVHTLYNIFLYIFGIRRTV